MVDEADGPALLSGDHPTPWTGASVATSVRSAEAEGNTAARDPNAAKPAKLAIAPFHVLRTAIAPAI